MQKPALSRMSIDELLKLRDAISEILAKKSAELQHQLSVITGSVGTGKGAPKGVKRRGRPKGSISKRRATKYKNPDGQIWSGRGRPPQWVVDARRKGTLVAIN